MIYFIKDKLYLPQTERIIFIGSKEIKFQMPEKALLRYSTQDNVWASEYAFEKTSINKQKIYKTHLRKIKCLLKTVELRFDLVRNEILAKDFNGIKTFITRNTQMFQTYLKQLRNKPFSTFGLLYKKIKILTPKLSHYYQTTGDVVGYAIYLFTNNITYEYVHNLMSYTASKKELFKELLSALQDKAKTNKQTVMAYQPYKKRKIKFRIGGLKIKFVKRLKRLKFKRLKKTLYNVYRSIKFKRIQRRQKSSWLMFWFFRLKGDIKNIRYSKYKLTVFSHHRKGLN